MAVLFFYHFQCKCSVSASLWIRLGLCTSPGSQPSLKNYSYRKTRASSKDPTFTHQLWEVQPVNMLRAAWKNVMFWGVHFAFHTILTRITDCEGEKILRNHLVHPLISQTRKMFTCERTVRRSDMSQFTQLDADLGPQAPSADPPAFSDDGKYNGYQAAKQERKGNNSGPRLLNAWYMPDTMIDAQEHLPSKSPIGRYQILFPAHRRDFRG